MLNTMIQLAFHEQLMLTFLLGSLLLCIMVGLGGFFIRNTYKKHLLPPVPIFPGGSFPAAFDYAYTIIFLLGFTLSIASVFFVSSPPENAETQISWQNLTISLAFQTCMYLPFLVRYYMLPARPCAIRSFGSIIVSCIICLAAIGIPALLFELLGGLDWLIEVTQCPQNQEIVETFKAGSIAEKFIIALAAVIIAPITEECCFRGFLYNILKQHSTRWLAVLASSLFFGAIHGSIAQLLPLTIFAIVQCIAYDKARTLRLPILVHASFNGISLLYILLFA